MKHFRDKTGCSHCELTEVIRRSLPDRAEIPQWAWAECKYLMNLLQRGTPGALDKVSRLEDVEGLFYFTTGKYRFGKSGRAWLWLAVAHRDTYEGLVMVAADVTGGKRERERLLHDATRRFLHGERHDTHVRH